ncbi:calcium-binding protein [Amaricoccus tamworthensis]|uniref:calcium-binding protein n=1 Tax=Amaricoccus tamworthensis TaxID=57002 RepID=UPI003C7D7B22
MEFRHSSTLGGSDRYPGLVQLDNGHLLTVWSDLGRDPGYDGATGVFAKIFSWDVVPLTLEFSLHTNTPGDDYRPRAAALKDGFVVAWDKQDDDGYLFSGNFRLFNNDGTPAGKQVEFASDDRDDVRIQDVEALKDGGFAIVTAEGYLNTIHDIVVYEYDADGEFEKSRKLATADDIGNSYFIDLPQADLTIHDSGAVLTWWEGNDATRLEDSVYAAAFKKSWKPDSDPVVISPTELPKGAILDPHDDDTHASSVALPNGDRAVIWTAEHDDDGTADSDVLFRLIDATGQTAGRVRTLEPGTEGQEQVAQDIVHLGGGFTLGIYADEDTHAGGHWDFHAHLMGQVFTPQGKVFGSALQITETLQEDVYRGDFELLKNGGLAGVWEADSTTGYRIDTYATVLGSDVGAFGVETFDGLVAGTPDNDKLSGSSNGDFILGASGSDRIKSGAGRDVVLGGDGKDKLSGGKGDDVIFGGGYRDRIEGDNGNDTLFGDRGDDGLKGGSGADMLSGGKGDDRLKGGKGGDVFVFDAGKDRIVDFGRGNDEIWIDGDVVGGSRPAVNKVMDYAEKKNGNIIIDFGEGDRLRIDDFTNMSELEDALLIV